ncbi:MAG: nucleotidyltransferase family protein [Symploca sp. SIO2D2]|nr:nucleotidyltransferase family protein [Symploca sp. SIO2D2]
MIETRGLGIRDLLGDYRSQILIIAGNHGAYNVRVFGSVARGEATSESDIDLLVDYDLKKISSWFPVGLIHDLQDLLGRKVDVVLSDSIHPFICDRINQEAIQL